MRGLYTHWCTSCGDASVIDYRNERPGRDPSEFACIDDPTHSCVILNGQIACSMNTNHNIYKRSVKCGQEPSHKIVLTHICVRCDATHYKDQVILPNNSIPYERSESGYTKCAFDDLGSCTEHLFECNDCPHVFCSACMIRAYSKMMGSVDLQDEPATNAFAKMFVVDNDDFIVPPCPICFSLVGDRKHSGCMSLQTLRGMPPETFNRLKSFANVSFRIRQTESSDEEDDDDNDERQMIQ